MGKKNIDPEKYGRTVCPGCYGHGFIKDYSCRNVCPNRGGFGFIKKEEDPWEKDDG